MIHVDSKPANLGESGWNAILPPRQAHSTLAQDIDCDYLVVGAGFAGLSAARRLGQLEAEVEVTVREVETAYREVMAKYTSMNAAGSIAM